MSGQIRRLPSWIVYFLHRAVVVKANEALAVAGDYDDTDKAEKMALLFLSPYRVTDFLVGVVVKANEAVVSSLATVNQIKEQMLQ